MEGASPRTFELVLNQNFQKVEGKLTVDGKPALLEDAKLVGDRLSFVVKLSGKGAARHEFDGRIVNISTVGVTTHAMKTPGRRGEQIKHEEIDREIVRRYKITKEAT